MRENRDLIVNILFGIAVMFGLVLLVKVVIAFCKAPLSFTWAISVLNFLLNLAAIVVTVAGFAVVIMGLGYLIVELLRQVLRKLDQARDIVVQITEGQSERVLPVLMTGLVEALVLTLSNDFASNSVKTLVSVYLWAFATILIMATLPGSRRRRVLGIVLLIVISLPLIGFVVFKHRLYDPSQLQALFEEVLSLPTWDALSIILITVLFLTMVGTAAWYGTGRRSMPQLPRL